MGGGNKQLEIKFRLNDGSDIGPKAFPNATTVAALKRFVISDWPTEKKNGPRRVEEVKLISGGKVLENDNKVKDYRSPLLGDVTTMHVIIQHDVTQKGIIKEAEIDDPKMNKCACSIM